MLNCSLSTENLQSQIKTHLSLVAVHFVVVATVVASVVAHLLKTCPSVGSLLLPGTDSVVPENHLGTTLIWHPVNSEIAVVVLV